MNNRLDFELIICKVLVLAFTFFKKKRTIGIALFFKSVLNSGYLS